MTLPLVPPALLVGLPEPVNRLYIANAAPEFSTYSLRGGWTLTSGYVDRALSRYVSGAAVTKVNNHTANDDHLYVRYISSKLYAAKTISGTMEFLSGLAKTSAGSNAGVKIFAYVTQGDANASRGTLVSTIVDSIWQITAAGRTTGALAVSSVAAQINDRIVIEFGINPAGVGLGYDGTHHYGNTGATNLSNGDTNVTTRPGWVNFSVALPLL